MLQPKPNDALAFRLDVQNAWATNPPSPRSFYDRLELLTVFDYRVAVGDDPLPHEGF